MSAYLALPALARPSAVRVAPLAKRSNSAAVVEVVVEKEEEEEEEGGLVGANTGGAEASRAKGMVINPL